MAEQLFSLYDEIVVLIKFPELAIDDVKVFVGEKLCFTVDVIGALEMRQHFEKIAPSQFRDADSTGP